MLIHKAYKFRLFPNEEQSAVLSQHGGNIRFTWNQLVNYAYEYKETNKHFPNKKELRANLMQVKKSNEFLKISHSQPLQTETDRLTDAIIRAFSPENIAKRNKKIAMAKNIKDPKKRRKKLKKALQYAMPKFKSKHNNHDSVYYPQNFKIANSRIYCAKMGWLNYLRHRKIEGKPKNITISQDGKLWFVSIMCELEIKEPVKKSIEQSNIVGIDVGSEKFANFSDKTIIENPRILKHHLEKIAKENRKLAKKQFVKKRIVRNGKKVTVKVSSKRRDKQIVKLQNAYRKCRNVRRDFLHKLTHRMIVKYDGFVLETLDIQGMIQQIRSNTELTGKQKRAIIRSILDVNWFEFSQILEYKSKWNGKYFVKVGRYFPSTQKCSSCGNIAIMSIDQRKYVCSCCGNVMGRDLNSSCTLRNEGIRILIEKRDGKIKVVENTKNDKNNTAASAEIYARGQLAKRVGGSEKNCENSILTSPCL